MGRTWRLENGCFYIEAGDTLTKAYSGDVYSSAFGVPSENGSLLEADTPPIKEAFPNIRFSKFSVSPRITFLLQERKIVIRTYFDKNGQEYPVPLPHTGDVDYGFAGNLWCYYSGEFYQIIELLEKVGIIDEEISFHQYLNLIKLLGDNANIHIDDFVNQNLASSELLGVTKDEHNDLQATLYPYQETGFKWLKYVTSEDCGCVLGDEMGLGKTLQVISVLVDRKGKKDAPSLVVAPLSLLENWRREVNRFAPCLSVCVHHGNRRTGNYLDLLAYDLIITSYGATINDLSMFEMIEWDLLILDEAQNIKNPNASRTVSIKQIPHRASIAVTGTPFENHMTDIWSILDFSVPGLLGTLEDYKNEYPDDISGAEKVEPILTALMLRRRVSEVAKDLPDKIVIPQPIVMDQKEAIHYEDLRKSVLASSDRRSISLAALTKLRMFCTHPFLIDVANRSKDPSQYSSKYSRFCEIVEEIVCQNEKMIVFTSYTDMFPLISEDIAFRFGIPVDCINGETSVDDRQPIIDSFSNKEGSAMLVLNPRAAGVGLNITAANHVIHYNLEWNPSLEDQATARAFRRGQDKTVFVYRMFYANTVEEIVNEKIASKRTLSNAAVVGSDGKEDTRAMILRALESSPLGGGIL